jgi:outer membrane cobalamin receptor
VHPGNALPLVPRALVNAGVDSRAGFFDFGATVHYVGRQWLRGDESNATTPLDAYTTAGLRVGVDAMAWNLSAVVDNAFDSHAAIFGTFNENRRTGDLERFLTPMNARTITLVVRREFGRGG